MKKRHTSPAVLAFGGKARLNQKIKYWRGQVKKQKVGTLAYKLAKETLDYLLGLKGL